MNPADAEAVAILLYGALLLVAASVIFLAPYAGMWAIAAALRASKDQDK